MRKDTKNVLKLEEISKISRDDDPLLIIENLLPFKKYLKSTIFKLFINGIIIILLIYGSLFVYEILFNSDRMNFTKNYFSLLSFGSTGCIIMVQFAIWSKTVATFPNQVRDMGCHLKCTGKTLYQNILKECKIIKIVIYLNIVVSMLASASFIPFIGDEAKINVFVYLTEKYLPRYFQFFKFIINVCFPCMGYTLVVPLIFCTHYVSHIKFQIMLLNGFLKLLQNKYHGDHNKYQTHVFNKLKLCVQLHNRIRSIHKEVMLINNPLGILMIFVSTVVFVSAAYFVLANISPQSNFRMYLILLTWALSAFTFCTTAQRLTDESEKIIINAYNCPWIHWNKENRRTLLMLMANSLRPINVTIYITETNHTLLVKLWKLAYTTLTCLASH